MSIADALRGAGAKPAGKRPYFLQPETERVLAITMAIAQELAVTRQRADTLERLLLDKGVLTAGEIDAFVPDRQAATERALWNQEYIARILRIVQQENEAAGRPHDIASEDVAAEVGAEA
jgi:polyhydroxyalkanoate synthesis regulator phasin